MTWDFFLSTLGRGDYIFLFFAGLFTLLVLFSGRDALGMLVTGLIIFVPIVYFNEVPQGIYKTRVIKVDNMVVGKGVVTPPYVKLEFDLLLNNDYLVFNQHKMIKVKNKKRDSYMFYTNLYVNPYNNKEKITITRIGTITYFDNGHILRLDILD